MVEVEVVSVAPHADEEVEIPTAPPPRRVPAARPDPQLAIGEKVLRAFREPVVRFGPRYGTRFVAVTRNACSLTSDGLERLLRRLDVVVVVQPRWRGVARIARADRRHADAAARPGERRDRVATDAGYRRLAALEPEWSRQAKPADRNRRRRIVRHSCAGDHRQAERLDPAELRRVHGVLCRVQRNANPNPAERPRVGGVGLRGGERVVAGGVRRGIGVCDSAARSTT